MAEVLDVVCNDCDSKFIALEVDDEREYESKKGAGAGVFSIGSGRVSSLKREKTSMTKQVLFCQCPKCGIRHQMYLDSETE